MQAQLQSNSLGDSAQSNQEYSQAPQGQSFGHNFGQVEVQPATPTVIQPKPIMRLSQQRTERGGDRLLLTQRKTDTTTPLKPLQEQVIQRQPQENQRQPTQSQQPSIQRPNPQNGQTINLNQSASNDPDKYVFLHAENNWFKAIDQYKQGILHHLKSPYENARESPHGMTALVDYRKTITDKLLKEVQEPTIKHEEAIRKSWWQTNISMMTTSQIDHANKIRSMRKDTQGNQLPSISNSLDEFLGNIKPVSGNAPGSDNPTSDIDVNLNGDGTEFAVQWLNQEFRKRYGNGKDSGIVYDVNFYAKDFVPGEVLFGEAGLKNSGKLTKDGSGNNRYKEWQPYQVKNPVLKQAEIQDQTIASLVMMRVNMEHDLEIWKEYKNQISPEMKPILDQAEQRYEERKKAIEEGLKLTPLSKLKPTEALSHDDSKDDKALMMGAENKVYEKVLKEEVEPKRIKFELLKQIKAPRDKIDQAYVELKQAKTKALMFANEAYYTEGAVVSTVTNRQQLGRMYKPKQELEPQNKDAKQGFKKLELTVDEHYHSLNEQIGFTFHALQGVNLEADKFIDDIPKVGKYIHRAYSEIKNICEILKIKRPFNEQERRAASDWEGVKQGKAYVPRKGYVADLAPNAMEATLINFGITETTPSEQMKKIKEKLIQYKKEVDKNYILSKGK